MKPKFVRIAMLSCVIGFVCIAIAMAEEFSSAILIGTKPTEAWNGKNYGLDDDIKPVLSAVLSDTLYLFYLKNDDQAQLSVFINKKEQVLSYWKDGGSIISGLSPKPKLYALDLDGNSMLDIVFIYSENMAGGKTSIWWQQKMLVVLNGNPNTTKIIPLASRDCWWFPEEDQELHVSNHKKGPGIDIMAFSMLFPANTITNNPGCVVVWQWKNEVRSLEEIDSFDSKTVPNRLQYEFRNSTMKQTEQDNKTVDSFLLVKASLETAILIK